MAPTVADKYSEGLTGNTRKSYSVRWPSVFRAKDADGRDSIANDSRLDWGRAPWTTDKNERDAHHDLESGMVFINRMVAPIPVYPLGE